MKVSSDLFCKLLSETEQLDAHQFFLNIGKELLNTLQADQCVFWAEDTEIDELHAIWSIDREGNSVRETVRVRKGQGIVGRVALDYKPLLVENASKDHRYLEEISNKRTIPNKRTNLFLAKYVWALPLISFDRLCGVLEIISRGPRKFLPSDLDFIQPLIKLIALAYPREARDDLVKLAEVCIRFLEERDRYTYGHSLRVAEYSMILANELNIPLVQRKEIQLCALLHDIGKVTLKDSILTNEGVLTTLERKSIQMHTIVGANIVRTISKNIADKVIAHHEHYDGKGYPVGLKGEQIPLCSRIIALADCIDAMLSERPYRPPVEIAKVIKEISGQAGKQFDPKIVDAFLKAYRSGKLNLPAEQAGLIGEKDEKKKQGKRKNTKK